MNVLQQKVATESFLSKNCFFMNVYSRPAAAELTSRTCSVPGVFSFQLILSGCSLSLLLFAQPLKGTAQFI